MVARGEIPPDDPRILELTEQIEGVTRANEPEVVIEHVEEVVEEVVEEEKNPGGYMRYHMEFDKNDQPVQITKRQMQMLLLEANIRED